MQASAHNKNLDVGANVFIGNLDPEIDEKLLYDTFSAFGVILQTPKVCLTLFLKDDYVFYEILNSTYFFVFIDLQFPFVTDIGFKYFLRV